MLRSCGIWKFRLLEIHQGMQAQLHLEIWLAQAARLLHAACGSARDAAFSIAHRHGVWDGDLQLCTLSRVRQVCKGVLMGRWAVQSAPY